MTDSVAWELILELGDGGLEAFVALMAGAGVPAVADPFPGRYGWCAGPDDRTVRIVLGYAGPSEAAVCWARDRAAAERHLEAIHHDLAARLFAIAGPVNLISFIDDDDAAPGAAALPLPAGKGRPGRGGRRSDETRAATPARHELPPPPKAAAH